MKIIAGPVYPLMEEIPPELAKVISETSLECEPDQKTVQLMEMMMQQIQTSLGIPSRNVIFKPEGQS